MIGPVPLPKDAPMPTTPIQSHALVTSPLVALAPPPLPLEVTASIIRHSLPPILDLSFAERYSILRKYLTISKRWLPLVRRELYRHVKLTTPARAALFLKRALGGRAEELDDASWMISLQLGSLSHSGHAIFPILEILQTCPRLEELRLINLEQVDAPTLSLAVGLTSLSLHDISFLFYDELRLHLPNLHSLSITDVFSRDSKNRDLPSAMLLSPLSLPTLHTVALHWVPPLQSQETATRVHYEQNMVPPSLGSIGNQIQWLVVGRFDTEEFAKALVDELEHCDNLEHLTINNPEALELVLAAIPNNSLKSLQIGAWYQRDTALDIDEEILQPLFGEDELPEGLKALERLSLPEVWDWGGTGDDGVLREGREDIRSLCDKHGVDLVERELNGEGEDKKVDDWQEIAMW
ncbi:hypothetical protein P7C70_g5251, partial [Phenoliferia sp. Uapishka_3]